MDVSILGRAYVIILIQKMEYIGYETAHPDATNDINNLLQY